MGVHNAAEVRPGSIDHLYQRLSEQTGITWDDQTGGGVEREQTRNVSYRHRDDREVAGQTLPHDIRGALAVGGNQQTVSSAEHQRHLLWLDSLEAEQRQVRT